MNRSKMNGFDMTGISFNKNLNLPVESMNVSAKLSPERERMGMNLSIYNDSNNKRNGNMFVGGGKLPNIQNSYENNSPRQTRYKNKWNMIIK